MKHMQLGIMQDTQSCYNDFVEIV